MPEHTRPYVALLQNFLREHEIRSVVDLGCGDWQFSRTIDWSGIDYLGLDVVRSVVKVNRRAFATASIHFKTLSIGDPLPPADLVVCKDVLQHLPLDVVAGYFAEFRKRYKHALVTNDVFPDDLLNVDISAGEARAIRPDLPPFSEDCTLVLEWEINACGHHWIKQTYHLLGNPS